MLFPGSVNALALAGAGPNARQLSGLAWTLGRAVGFPPRPSLQVTAIEPSETYPTPPYAILGGDNLRPEFLSYTEYTSRQFIAGVGADVALLKHAKAVAAPGWGFIDEFNVGGGAALPLDLLKLDLNRHPDGWRAKTRAQLVSGLSIPFCHYGLSAFGHFVLDGLYQIFLFRDLLMSGQARLVHWALPAPWMNEVIDACGLPRSARRELTGDIVLLERAMLSSALAAHGVYFPNVGAPAFFDWLRSTFLTGSPDGPRRLYLRRSNSFSRRIVNGDEVEALANSHGFLTVSPEKLPFAEQIRLFCGADTVMSAWGSGLTLAPLCQRPGSVIELLPDTVTDPWFVRQAIVHNLDYRPIVHTSMSNGDFSADLGLIETALAALGPA